jgi:hypothetical protein
VPYYRDNLVTNLPLRRYLHERFLSGELPHWYPYESLGVPFIGQVASGVFHPATWLLLPFDPLAAVKLNLVLAYLVGAVGAYRLARLLPSSRPAAALAAVAFAYGGYALGVSSIVFYAMSQATLPWVAWAALRVARKRRTKDAALLGLAWGLMFLSGDPQGFLLCGLVVLVALVEGVDARRLVLFVAAGGVAALLCGVELLPSTVVAAQSLRVQGTPGPTMGLTWALHPLRLPELLIPGYIPDPVRFRVVGELLGGGTAVFATTLFAGGVTLLLACAGVASRRRVPLLKRAVPFFTRLRYPEKYVAFTWLALVPLVAAGLDHARARLDRWWKGALGLAAACGLLALLTAWRGLSADVWAALGRPLPAGDEVAGVVDAAWRSGLLWTALFTALAAGALWAARRRPQVLLALPLLAFLELWRGNGAHLPLVPRALFDAENPFVEAIRARSPEGPPPGRVLREVDPPVPSTVTGGGEPWVLANLYLLKADLSGLYGLPTLGDNLGAISARYATVLGAGSRMAPRRGPLFNGCFRVVDVRRPMGQGEERLAEEGALGLALLRSPCRPRAYLAGARPVGNLREATAALDALPPGVVVWEGGPEVAPEPVSGTVRWLEYRPELLRLEVDAAARSALVISDELTEGWRATIDGAPADLFLTLGVARGLVVPPGRHQVTLTYRTPRLLEGALASGLGLLGAVALILGGRRTRAPVP